MCYKIAVNALYSLASPDTSYLVVLKRRKDPGHQGFRPFHIVVGQDCDLRLALVFLESLIYLQSLISLVDVEDLNRGRIATLGRL